MPKNKDLKRLTRSRMQKTGESYTTARAKLVQKSGRVSTPELAARAGMSDDTVHAKTGRTWSEWVRILDTKGATSMPHRDIAVYVHEEHGVSRWWAQTVTVGYERIRGLREKGQRRGGTYEANKSKTFPVPVAKLYRAFSLTRTRNRWLAGVKWTVRKAVSEKSMRVTWADGTSVELYFTAKASDKSQVALQHTKLVTQSDATQAKNYWGARLDELSKIFASPQHELAPKHRKK